MPRTVQRPTSGVFGPSPSSNAATSGGGGAGHSLGNGSDAAGGGALDVAGGAFGVRTIAMTALRTSPPAPSSANAMNFPGEKFRRRRMHARAYRTRPQS